MVKYQHEMDKVPYAEKKASGMKPVNDFGCDDFKKEAYDQSYGQAGKAGCMKDQAKIKSQHYRGAYSDDSSGHE